MLRLLFFVQQVLAVPYNIISAPFRAGANTFGETGRGRALMLGLPAVLVAVIGVGLVSYSAFGNQSALENQYNTWAEKAGDEKTRLFNELSSEKRLQKSRQRSADGSSNVTIDENDPRIKELENLHSAEEIYLQKLIDLNQNEPDYRYRLAIVANQRGERATCTNYMKAIAPDDEPGYGKAHLWMAQYYVNTRVQNPSQRRQMLQLALKHAEHCLVRDSSNMQAKMLKAQLLQGEQRFVEARSVYQELFDEDPRFYSAIVDINARLGEEESSRVVLDQAQLRFKEAVDQASRGYTEDWSRAWINLVACLRRQQNFDRATKLLHNEESIQAKLTETEGTPEAAARHIHIKQLLTQIYTDWAQTLAADDLTQRVSVDEGKQLELLKRAIQFNPKNARALQLIARIAASDSEFAEEAKKIYDPEKHEDAPAEVLNEMGSQSLRSEKYDLAIKYFELARRKSPNDPQVLNNLAYTYLVCENKNPDRALQLVNQAIRAIARVTNSESRRTLASHFFDTKGRALMQMDRMDEAAAALEMAMQVRPENKDILEALIRCYEGRDDLQAEVYRKRLEELKFSESENGEDESGEGN